ncbi:hypothetical protein [Halobacillus campisalis]|uniref:hypothetical protein n=1 Tax=Halobacillus campisalis TaxID=435909 RepID=UPI0036F1F46C
MVIERVDWLFFIMALISLPFWYLTSDPLCTVLILSTVEVLGFAPTLRKAYRQPYQENVTFFFLFMMRNGLSIIALEHYSITTVLFPAAGATACLLLITTVIYRRKSI